MSFKTLLHEDPIDLADPIDIVEVDHVVAEDVKNVASSQILRITTWQR